MRARIFQPPRSATQSGSAKTHAWIVEFITTSPKRPDPLMGWIGGADTQTQVRLIFDTKEDAIAYADRNGLDYEVELPTVRRSKPKAYADNFRYGRVENWTH